MYLFIWYRNNIIWIFIRVSWNFQKKYAYMFGEGIFSYREHLKNPPSLLVLVSMTSN